MPHAPDISDLLGWHFRTYERTEQHTATGFSVNSFKELLRALQGSETRERECTWRERLAPASRKWSAA